MDIVAFLGFKSLSNMPLVKTTQLEDGWVKEEFDETPVMSTYLLAFIVADFQHRETTTDEGLKVRTSVDLLKFCYSMRDGETDMERSRKRSGGGYMTGAGRF